MPAVSKKQYRFFQLALHNKDFAEKAGIPHDVAKEFTEHAAESMSYNKLPERKFKKLKNAMKGPKKPSNEQS